MGLGAPLALLALAAAALPLIAHLLRRQDLPRRPLPTVMLLRRAVASSRRRLRIVDLLLLAARVTMTVLFAVALGEPFLETSPGANDGSTESVVFIIDDSMSMARGSDGESWIDLARSRARAVLESLPDGSEAALVLAGTPARTVVPRTDRLDSVATALERRVTNTARGTDLQAAARLAERELSGARHARRRVVVFTDGAAHADAAELSLAAGLEWVFERVGDADRGINAAIVEARAAPAPNAPGRASVFVEVRAQGMDGRSIPLILRRDAAVIARETIVITQGGARAALLADIDPANPAAEVTLDVEDALDADDRRGVLLRAVSGARVLIIEGAPPSASPGAGRFLTRALDLAPPSAGAFSWRKVDPETFSTMSLDDVDVIVLANTPPLGERAAARVLDFVRGGGSALVAPGDAFDARAYAARLEGILPARPSAPRHEDRVGLRTPAPSTDGDPLPSGSSGLDATRTRMRIGLDAASQRAEVLLEFDDGTPALLLADAGAGSAALLATSLDDAWTDLPYRPGFVSLVAELLARLAPEAGVPPGPVAPGSSVSLAKPRGTIAAEVLDPTGSEVVFSEDSAGRRLVLAPLTIPGAYRVRVATRERGLTDAPRLAFVVAPPPEESDLRAGALPAPRRDSAPRRASAVGRLPLAPWLFFALGAVFVAESVLRFGPLRLRRARA